MKGADITARIGHWLARMKGPVAGAVAAVVVAASLLGAAIAALLGSSTAIVLLAVLAVLAAGFFMVVVVRLFGRPALDEDEAVAALADEVTTSSPTSPLAPSSSPSPGPLAPDETWRGLLDVLGEAALVLDRAAVVLHANAAARGHFPRLVDGQPLAFAVRDPGLLEAVDEACETGGRRAAEVAVRVPFERHLTAEVAALAVGGSAGMAGLPAALVVLRDRSSQHRLMQMRADFIANASHELRTPLAALRGFIDTLIGPARDDKAARDRFLPMMASQALRMSRLIDDLLLLSRIEERAHLPPRGSVDVGAIASETIELLRPQATSREVTIHWKAPSPRIEVTGDRDELLQVVQNLVQNGVKYGRVGGAVQVTLERLPDGRVELLVADDGPGIAAEHLPRLTERFYRVSAAHSREIGGTGLGLAIVKHIVNRHGGELSISSTVGKGATFGVRLPEKKKIT